MDSRFRTVVRQVAKAFNLPTNEVEEAMFTEAHVGLINDFLGVAGPVRLVVGLLVPEGANQSGAEGLFMTAGDDVRITGKSVLVVRLSEAELTTSNMDSEVMVGVIQGSPIKTLLATLQHVYMPALGQRTSDWAAKLSEESSTEFVGSVGKFVEMLDEAVTSLESGLELAKPEFKYDVENKQPAFNRAAGQPELVGSFEGVVESWCSRVEDLLAENDQSRAASAEDVGPETELEYWRSRMGKLNSITEQLRGKDCKVVLGVLAASKSRVLKRWRALDNAITDAANEAKDNVKYLATLEKHIEALYSGSPAAMVECLPSLLNNIKMMLTIARYYNTTERMTNLFRKITNQAPNLDPNPGP
jgi:dynein heavy chain